MFNIFQTKQALCRGMAEEESTRVARLSSQLQIRPEVNEFHRMLGLKLHLSL